MLYLQRGRHLHLCLDNQKGVSTPIYIYSLSGHELVCLAGRDQAVLGLRDTSAETGLMWVYIAFNIVGSAAIYRLLRVPKEGKKG